MDHLAIHTHLPRHHKALGAVPAFRQTSFHKQEINSFPIHTLILYRNEGKRLSVISQITPLQPQYNRINHCQPGLTDLFCDKIDL